MPRLKMLLFICCFVYLTFCMNESGARTVGGKGASRQYRQTRGGGYYNGEVDQFSRSTIKPQTKTARGPGISAWGIIAIILSLIFIGFAAYYFYLLYPIFCKKERQYNTIELVAV